MKIENSGVNVTPKPSTAASAARKLNPSESDGVKVATSRGQLASVADSIVISGSSADKAVTSGDYSARVLAPRIQNKLQPMSDLKKTADERLKQFGSDNDSVESVSELNMDDDRKDMVEIAKLRVKSGFYDRPDVVDEIARRIIEGV